MPGQCRITRACMPSSLPLYMGAEDQIQVLMATRQVFYQLGSFPSPYNCGFKRLIYICLEQNSVG